MKRVEGAWCSGTPKEPWCERSVFFLCAPDRVLSLPCRPPIVDIWNDTAKACRFAI